MSKRVVLLRHPTTELNTEGKVRGWLDVPLSEKGLEEVPHIAAKLKAAVDGVKRVVTSDLQRAEVLGGAVAATYNVPITSDWRARTWDVGKMAGKISDKLGVPGGPLDRYSRGDRAKAPPSGESFDTFLKRWCTLLEEVGSEDGTTVVVTHVQNIVAARQWARGGCVKGGQDMPYKYDKKDEVPPGGWMIFEVK